MILLAVLLGSERREQEMEDAGRNECSVWVSGSIKVSLNQLSTLVSRMNG